ncbi:MAG: hypothetical protein ABIH37_02775, partial [archaeon]
LGSSASFKDEDWIPQCSKRQEGNFILYVGYEGGQGSPPVEPVCNNNGQCDEGETYENCPNDNCEDFGGECVDSDGGKDDFFTPGETRYTNEGINDVDYDTCVNENTLAEQYCPSTTSVNAQNTVTCELGCIDSNGRGACKKSGVDECSTDQQCQDKFQSCYYQCQLGICQAINKILPLGNYPNCGEQKCPKFCPPWEPPPCPDGNYIPGGKDECGCELPPTCCGDGGCDGEEGFSNCPSDCDEPVCGDGSCDKDEECHDDSSCSEAVCSDEDCNCCVLSDDNEGCGEWGECVESVNEETGETRGIQSRECESGTQNKLCKANNLIEGIIDGIGDVVGGIIDFLGDIILGSGTDVTLHIFDEDGKEVYSNTKLLGEGEDSADWGYNLPKDGKYTWNCESTDKTGKTKKGDERIIIYDAVVCGDGPCEGDETVNNCPQDCKGGCAGEGEGIYNEARFGPTECCDKTSGIKPPWVEENGNCVVENENLKGFCVDDWDEKCGNFRCDAGEDECSCPSDCPAVCPNGVCEEGEDVNNCVDDCLVSCGNGPCEPELGETVDNCPKDCEVKINCNKDADCGDERTEYYCDQISEGFKLIPDWQKCPQTIFPTCMNPGTESSYCEDKETPDTGECFLCEKGCENGVCKDQTFCGDEVCEGDETLENCPDDCKEGDVCAQCIPEYGNTCSDMGADLYAKHDSQFGAACDCMFVDGPTEGWTLCESDQCTTNKECQDEFESCYYECQLGECQAINTVLPLGDYPECEEEKECEDYRYSTCPEDCEKRCVASCPTCDDCEGFGSCYEPEDCVKEGETFGTYLGPGMEPSICCDGLTSISIFFLGEEGGGNECIRVSDSAVCTKCGIDDVCGLGENRCNCPQDCEGVIKCSENSDCGEERVEYYCSDEDKCPQTIVPTCINLGTENSFCEDTQQSNSGACIECEAGCLDGECLNEEQCKVNDDCEDKKSENYCSAGNVYYDFKDFSCNLEGVCEAKKPEKILVEPPCEYGCEDGKCKDITIECISDDECEDEYSEPYCSGNDVYKSFTDYSCVDGEGVCTAPDLPEEVLVSKCDAGCTDGKCDEEVCGDGDVTGSEHCEEDSTCNEICSRCGEGLFDICDRDECNSIGLCNFFPSGVLGGILGSGSCELKPELFGNVNCNGCVCEADVGVCTTNKECQDEFESCYYECQLGSCVAIDTFASLGEYPDCQTDCNNNNICEPEIGEDEINCPGDCIRCDSDKECWDYHRDCHFQCLDSLCLDARTDTGTRITTGLGVYPECEEFCGNNLLEPQYGEQCEIDEDCVNLGPGLVCENCQCVPEQDTTPPVITVESTGDDIFVYTVSEQTDKTIITVNYNQEVEKIGIFVVKDEKDFNKCRFDGKTDNCLAFDYSTTSQTSHVVSVEINENIEDVYVKVCDSRKSCYNIPEILNEEN